MDSTSKFWFGIIFLAGHIPSWLGVSCFVVVVVFVFCCCFLYIATKIYGEHHNVTCDHKSFVTFITIKDYYIHVHVEMNILICTMIDKSMGSDKLYKDNNNTTITNYFKFHFHKQ